MKAGQNHDSSLHGVSLFIYLFYETRLADAKTRNFFEKKLTKIRYHVYRRAQIEKSSLFSAVRVRVESMLVVGTCHEPTKNTTVKDKRKLFFLSPLKLSAGKKSC
jgi:hypothetical protein